MLRIFLTAFLVFTLAAPVMAQEEAASAGYEQRRELAKQMHEIWPVRPRVENALEAVSEQLEEQDRLRFKAQMRKAIKFDKLEEESVNAMAEIFTAEELTAMVEFYGSKTGRAISAKTGDYEKALMPIVTEMMDKAILEVKLGMESGSL